MTVFEQADSPNWQWPPNPIYEILQWNFYTSLYRLSSVIRNLMWAAEHSPIRKDRGQLKCDGTRAETRFCLSAKRTSPFKSAGASVQSTTGSRGVRISGSNAGYTMFRGSVKGTGYPLHSPVSPSLPLPYVTLFHHISTGVYNLKIFQRRYAHGRCLMNQYPIHSICVSLWSPRNTSHANLQWCISHR